MYSKKRKHSTYKVFRDSYFLVTVIDRGFVIISISHFQDKLNLCGSDRVSVILSPASRLEVKNGGTRAADSRSTHANVGEIPR